jgi:hypothetical protein
MEKSQIEVYLQQPVHVVDYEELEQIPPSAHRQDHPSTRLTGPLLHVWSIIVASSAVPTRGDDGHKELVLRAKYLVKCEGLARVL